jgi:hypothetical protein
MEFESTALLGNGQILGIHSNGKSIHSQKVFAENVTNITLTITSNGGIFSVDGHLPITN